MKKKRTENLNWCPGNYFAFLSRPLTSLLRLLFFGIESKFRTQKLIYLRIILTLNQNEMEPSWKHLQAYISLLVGYSCLDKLEIPLKKSCMTRIVLE